MSLLRCPVCRAENALGPSCRRCKADLSLLFELDEQRLATLAAARVAAGRGDWRSFGAWATRADALRSNDETRRLVAVACLLQGDYAGALREVGSPQARSASDGTGYPVAGAPGSFPPDEQS